jgi:hypothetical protein
MARWCLRLGSGRVLSEDGLRRAFVLREGLNAFGGSIDGGDLFAVGNGVGYCSAAV